MFTVISYPYGADAFIAVANDKLMGFQGLGWYPDRFELVSEPAKKLQPLPARILKHLQTRV